MLVVRMVDAVAGRRVLELSVLAHSHPHVSY